MQLKQINMKENAGKNFLQAGSEVLLQLADYLDNSKAGNQKVLDLQPLQKLKGEMNLKYWIHNGGMDMNTIGEFLSTYLSYTQHIHHPGYIGHQVAVPHYASALADLIHGFTNNPASIYEMGPAAATIELAIINWMLEKIGWLSWSNDFTSHRENGAGVLTHGGSLANLTALLAARAAIAPEAWVKGVPPDLVVLVSPAAHYSISRAVSIMGLGSNAIIPLAVDKNEVVIASQLEGIYQEVTKQGKRVMALVASACSTSTGLYDPIEAIAEFCEKKNIWLHVDGAHGMSAVITEKEKHLLRGIEKADSLIWDAHKMLRTSTLCAAVLFRDQDRFNKIFHQQGSYLFYDDEAIGIDFLEHTVECTKAGLGTKLFWVLAFLGEKGLAQYVEDQYVKTKKFYQIISDTKGFECPYYPQSNILCFRYGQDNQLQIDIRNVLLKRGDFYITSTEINGIRYLRLSVMNPGTDENTIAELLADIAAIANGLHDFNRLKAVV